MQHNQNLVISQVMTILLAEDENVAFFCANSQLKKLFPLATIVRASNANEYLAEATNHEKHYDFHIVDDRMPHRDKNNNPIGIQFGSEAIVEVRKYEMEKFGFHKSIIFGCSTTFLNFNEKSEDIQEPREVPIVQGNLDKPIKYNELCNKNNENSIVFIDAVEMAMGNPIDQGNDDGSPDTDYYHMASEGLDEDFPNETFVGSFFAPKVEIKDNDTLRISDVAPSPMVPRTTKT